MTKLWGGRFSEEPAAELLAFTESLSFDHVLARDDCAVLAAHARALARAMLLSPEEARGIERALFSIAQEIEAGEIAFEPTDEDIHTVVERALLARLPEAAAKSRAGLSRNDRVATALRLWLRREGRRVVDSLADLIEVLAARAREHAATLMPGYTHLQRAQPITAGHHLLAHAFALTRDAQRLSDALARADASPLGSGALAGSTLGLDAAATAADLGFVEAIPNSLDAVSARDFVAEFLAAAAILGVHCSRIAEELIIWTSTEFGFARLPDAYATGSSLMPQKRNPDVAELARAKTGRLIGNLTGLLATLKGLPFAYNRDLQEDKEPLFDSVRTLQLLLPALAGAIAALELDRQALERAACDRTLLATDAAEDLVREGTPFREAHETIGRSIADGTDVAVGAEDALAAARRSVDRRGSPGPAPRSVDAQLERIAEDLARIRSGAPR